MQVSNGGFYTTVGNCRQRIPGVIQCYNNGELIDGIPIDQNHLKALAVFDDRDNFVCYVRGQGQTSDEKRATYMDDSASAEFWNLPKGYSIKTFRELKLISDSTAKEVTIH